MYRIECASSAALASRYSQLPPDVVLVGTERAVGAGVDAVRRLVAAHHSATVIVFGAPEDAASITAAIVAGAAGFLGWDGCRPGRSSTGTHPTAGTGVCRANRTVTDHRPQLTERELQVLRGMTKGYSNAQIGREVFLSEDTVKTHARRLFRTLSVRDRPRPSPRVSGAATSPDPKITGRVIAGGVTSSILGSRRRDRAA